MKKVETSPYNPHENHRQRMRDRLIATDGGGFADHELLEMLLFYSIPRQNTNETAHALLRAFGSLENVFAASVEELCSVPGIGKSSAELIRLEGEVISFLAQESSRLVNRHAASKEELENEFRALAAHAMQDYIHIRLFDELSRTIDCFDVYKEDDDPENLIQRFIALREASFCMIVFVRHAEELPLPSLDEIRLLQSVAPKLRLLGTPLLDAVVTTAGQCNHIARDLAL